MPTNRRLGLPSPAPRGRDVDRGLDEDSALEERTVLARGAIAELQAALQALHANASDPALDERTVLSERVDLEEAALFLPEGAQDETEPAAVPCLEEAVPAEVDPGDDEATSLFERTTLDALLAQSLALGSGIDPVLHEETVIMEAPSGLDEDTLPVSRAELEAFLKTLEAASPLAVLESKPSEPCEASDELTVPDGGTVDPTDVVAPAGMVLFASGEEAPEDEPTGIVRAPNPRVFGGVSAFPFAMPPAQLDRIGSRRSDLRLVRPVVVSQRESVEAVVPAETFPTGAVRAERRAWVRRALA